MLMGWLAVGELKAQDWIRYFLEESRDQGERLEAIPLEAWEIESEEDIPNQYFLHWRFPMVRDFRSGLELRNQVGIYPFSSGLRIPERDAIYLSAFQDRLYRLIGKGNALMVQNILFVQTPLTLEDEVIFGSVCKPHECGSTYLSYWYDTRIDQLVALFVNQEQFHLYLEQPQLSVRILQKMEEEGWDSLANFGW
jgi:hypothetical protein